VALPFIVMMVGCASEQPPPAGGLHTDAVYSRQTGRLEKLTADQNGDGKTDIVAFMDGTRLQRIEIDRNSDGAPDRWEEYGPGETATGGNPLDRWAVLLRAEQSDRPDHQITRREFYANGLIDHDEEDTNLDGKVDKWEFYDRGVLKHVDLDLIGRGSANQRLVYADNGDVERIEVDPEGDGTFVAQASATK
jgi:hypothetical protein